MRVARSSTVVLWGLAVALAANVLVVAHATLAARWVRADAATAIIEALDLTDLVLFTEARYTRHRTQADQHSPFQDGPRTLEHFPAGSMAPPPHHNSNAGFSDRETEDAP